MLPYLKEFAPYLLVGLFIIAEIVCVAITGTDLIILLIRWIQRKLHNSKSVIMITIPARLQTQIANETLSPGTPVKIVTTLPLIPEADLITLTEKETKSPAGSTFYLAEIHKNSLVISQQKLFLLDEDES